MSGPRHSERQRKVDERHRRNQIHRFLKGFFGKPVSDTELDIIVNKWNATKPSFPLDEFLRKNQEVWPKGYQEK